MLNFEEIENYLIQHKSELSAMKVKRIGVFGSFVRNEQKEDSDIDFLVEYSPGSKNFENYIALVNYLEKSFSRNVDLLTPESISKYFKPYIEKEIKYVQISD